MTIKEYNSTVPDRIVEIIKQNGMKQCAVAEKAGITPQRLTDMLNGRRIIRINELLNLASALGVDTNELLLSKTG